MYSVYDRRAKSLLSRAMPFDQTSGSSRSGICQIIAIGLMMIVLQFVKFNEPPLQKMSLPPND